MKNCYFIALKRSLKAAVPTEVAWFSQHQNDFGTEIQALPFWKDERGILKKLKLKI